MYFVLPKSQIELVAEKGYSYVPVLIQGRKCHLNVSGGGGSGGWTDYVRRVAHIGCGWSLSALRQLAAIAVSPGECRSKGVTLEIEPLADDQRRGFVERAAAATMRNRLQGGSQVVLRDGWDFMGSQGPFAVGTRPQRKRYFICSSGSSQVRVQYTAIDWPKTAEINGVAVPEPAFVNRIAPVLEPVAV